MSTHTTSGANVDPAEVGRFDALASRWWDPAGEMRPLHELNPLRTRFVTERAPVSGARVIDVGCGGGILSEALAAAGASVTGIDASEAAIAVARLHLFESGLDVDYRVATAEETADSEPGAYDVVTCMELIEHVPDPIGLLGACARLVRPGGDVFVSTINRRPKAWLMAVLGAEYVMRLLPRGTHDYRRFVRPSELAAWARHHRLEVRELRGVEYRPITHDHRLTRDPSVNYVVWMRRPAP
ncbi:MAG: bifunctional 2-polyprenyl-6-hydroxyphenol methylase/3-demethylubiquinol 3-O-methyltransferase UbiG [Ectothiorhodospiraceae bacterium]|nr:bifunctional 2-polyprenyl-6-hydroxyphenol methylase/3-demethylubiquinol 3-O-methyltransferase UbiG [Ectothiorhodospiraceae bacterium]